MTPLRVAYLIDSLGGGGSERSLVEMLPHLVASGIEPRIFVLVQPERDFASLVAEAGLEVEPLPSTGWLTRRAWFRRQLVAWPADLLHTTLFYSDQLGRLAAWRSGVPVVSSLVSVGYEPERLDDPRIRAWRLGLLRRLDGVTGRYLTRRFHAVSEAVKSSAVTRLGLSPKTITVVRRGRDPRHYPLPAPEQRDEGRRRWGVGEEEILLVNIGRQTFHKGQLALLRAVERLTRAGRPIRLVIAGGEGSASDELRRYIAEHSLEERVRLTGHLDDVAELLVAADAFVFPSRLEGCPGAVLEAAAMGLPVVATAIPALEEIFPGPRDALLVPRDSVERLTEAIATLADDPKLRQQLGQKSRDIFLERFDIQKVVPRMVDLYRDVVANGGRG